MKKKRKFLKSISVKLIIMFLIVSIIPLGIIGVISSILASNALEKSAYNRLEYAGTDKGEEIISFLDRKIRDAGVLAQTQNIKDAFYELREYKKVAGITDDGPFITNSENYDSIYKKIDPYFRKYVKEYNFYDFFIICADHGHVMYTVVKEDDLGTNLTTGEYRKSGLAKLWKKVVDSKKPMMSDFEYYAPSGDNAAFIGVPVFDNEGKLILVAVLQLSNERINQIMNRSTGLGKTGETYLVGNDYLMRSDSRFSTKTTILNQKVENENIKLAFEGKTGTGSIIDYRGMKVLSFYKNLDLKEKFGTDFSWVILAEIDQEEAFLTIDHISKLIILIGLVIGIIVFFTALLFSRIFTKPILLLKEFSGFLTLGDLTHDIEIKRDDELGELAKSFMIMQYSLKKQIKEIAEGVNVISSSSSEIMAMVSQLASSSVETASSVSETSSSIEEIKQIAEVSYQKAIEVADSSQKIALVSQEGNRSVKETIEGMNKIKRQMESIASIVIQLSEKSIMIGEIASTVNDIAEQSNLLAVNASIEAAKAGEQGKGFSVVAQEIKNLAEKSKESTVQIKTIISDIQKEIGSAVMATEQGGKVIDEGLNLSSSASQVITTLAASIEQAAQANLQIAASSQQQVVGMDQITSAMESINEASTQASTSTKQTEDALSGLNGLGEKLLNMMKKYKLS